MELGVLLVSLHWTTMVIKNVVRVAVAGAIGGALIAAKLNTIPIRRGYWGKKAGLPHTVPVKVTGKCGSVRVRLIPAPRHDHVESRMR